MLISEAKRSEKLKREFHKKFNDLLSIKITFMKNIK